jgi:RNA polymerase sigma factor (sigma-70 family)
MANATATKLRKAIRSVAPAIEPAATDRELIRRFAEAKDQAAFAALVARHTAMVLGVCQRALSHRQDAEDACQATFLVLARKAKSGRWQASVANWLYATARKVAHNARVAADRRARREARAAVSGTVTPVDRMTGRELLAVLDEELDRLPPTYREPLILCFLEGLTRDEAAARLGIAVETLKVRIHRGRKRLHDALTKGGVAVGAGLLALAASSPAGASPPRFVESVVAAASGSPPATVAALAEGVAVNGLLRMSVAAVVLSAGLLALGTRLDSAPVTAAGPARADAPPGAESLEVSGRVLGPDGRPIAGARLSVWTGAAKKDLSDTTGKDGRFRVAVRRADLRDRAALVATADGFGPDWLDLDRLPAAGTEAVLKLSRDDVPIVGRLINLEGRPIAGVTVRVRRLEKRVDDGDLDLFIATKRKWAQGDYARGADMKALPAAALSGPQSVTTDADGKVRFTGFGRERVVSLEIEGQQVEPIYLEVLTRTDKVEGLASGNENDDVTGATFERIVAPGKAVVGTVRDKATGKPVAGLRVTCGRCSARTDAEGRYRVDGPRKRPEYTVAVNGVPYFGVTKTGIADTPGFAPVTVDFELERGVAIRGRVLDKNSGKPVAGIVKYLAFADNPALKTVSALGPTAWIEEDGSFAITGLPGRGVLAVDADEDNYRKFEPAADWDLVPTINWIPGVSHAFVRIDASEEDPKSTAVEVRLEPTAQVSAEVSGPDGKPFAGYYVGGLTASSRGSVAWTFPRTTPTFVVRGLDKERTVVVVSKDLKLGKVQEFRAGAAGPVGVKLEPVAALTGRATDAAGRPLANAKVRATLDRSAGTRLPVQLSFDSAKWVRDLQPTSETDGAGKFRLTGLLPGLSYTLTVTVADREVFQRNGVSPPEAGTTRDVGDLTGKALPK